MLNHGRTLLGNFNPSSYRGHSFFLEEPVSAEFYPVRLPSELLAVRRVLFGTRPDRAMLNYRLAQLMPLLHTTEFREYLSLLDSRCTYWPGVNNDYVDNSNFEPVVTRLSGSDSSQLSVYGSPAAPDETGVMRREFTVDVLGDTVKVLSHGANAWMDILPIEMVDGLSNEMQLSGTGYKFRINTTDPATTWRVEMMLRPQQSPLQMIELLGQIGAATIVNVFGVSKEEPWNTFRNLWQDHSESTFKMIGLLLAVIFRTQEIYENG